MSYVVLLVYGVVHLCASLFLIHLLAMKTHVPFDSPEEEPRVHQLLHWLSLTMTLMGVVTWCWLNWVGTAPFGRHASQSHVSVRLPSSLSWFLQEAPTLLNICYTCLHEIPCSSPNQQCTHLLSEAVELYGSYCAAGPSALCVQLTLKESGMSLVKTASASMRYLNTLALALFAIHYIHRCLLFPLALPSSANRVPVHVTLAATLYCVLNGRLQVLTALSASREIRRRGADIWVVHAEALQHGVLYISGLLGYEEGLDASGRTSFILFAMLLASVALWAYGMSINLSADYHLLRLKRLAATARKRTDRSTYRIPYGGWFTYVSCPNFFGEILEWCGYACAAWISTAIVFMPIGLDDVHNVFYNVWTALRHRDALTALAGSGCFAWYTASNLLPRGAAHHEWYLQQFGNEYRSLQRHAVIPNLF